MIGDESELCFKGWFGACDYIIELELTPFAVQSLLPYQRLTVSVNRTVVGHSTILQSGRLGYRVPAAVLRDRKTTSIVLTHPDGARPCDFGRGNDDRVLSLSLKRLTAWRIRPGTMGLRMPGTGGIRLSEIEQSVGMAPEKFILNFESLGDNCEFGLVQRRCGAEPLSLLRFSNIQLSTLLRGLDVGFNGLGEAADVGFRVEGKAKAEYVIQEKRYGLSFHTFRYRGEVDEEKLIASEPARLTFLLRKFLEDLSSGDKIFVFKRNTPLLEDEILPLYAALNFRGRNVLLWLVPADEQHKSGSAELVIPGLIKGYMDRFAPLENAHDLLLEAWLEVCANAYRLARKETSSFGAIPRRWFGLLGQVFRFDKRKDLPSG
jgi:hypothetical protein